MTTLVIVAHPDDETIGAGASLATLRDVHVLHLTNGAPRDRRFVAANFEGTLEAYASVRAAEARAAMALANVHDVRSLGCDDQDAIHHVHDLAHEVGKVVSELRPDAIVTLAYEGGHPDHDACAVVVQSLGVPRREMPLYHARNSTFVPNEFIDADDEQIINLTDSQRALKQKMFDCYATQRAVLAQFPIARERFRAAPQYDFSKPPHDGPLWYEILGWPMSGAEWRRLACR